MVLDWHITCLSYCTHTVNIKALGEEKFKQRMSTFYAPFQYPKEVHKNIKMLNNDFIDKFLFNGQRDISLVDFFVFSELMTLNLIGHNLEKYPRVTLYLKNLAFKFNELKESLKSVEAYAKMNGYGYYLGDGFGESGAKL